MNLSTTDVTKDAINVTCNRGENRRVIINDNYLAAIGIWLLAFGFRLKVKKNRKIMNKIHEFDSLRA